MFESDVDKEVLRVVGTGDPTAILSALGSNIVTPAEGAYETENDVPTRSQSSWPDPLNEEAYYGLAGEFVRKLEPHTEADSAALLVQFLVAFGNLVGRGPYFPVEADRHFTNLYAVIVGQTAKGRKGISMGHVKAVFETVDRFWTTLRLQSGLSSGEGLIWAVRDEIRGLVKTAGRNAPQDQVIDAGISDKRLLVTEGEFARVLQVSERPGNTLSAVVRDGWDTGHLSSMTKNAPAHATGAHISIVGHITKDELKRLLTNTAMANGFANRFLFVCSRRSKCLPDGGTLDQDSLADVIRRLTDAVCRARAISRMSRDEEAREIWHGVYPALSEGRPGLLGAVTSRSEAQVLRLSCVYALLDGSPVVRAAHLLASLAVWQYCEESARFIFGDALGDPTADEIIRELRKYPLGMTRTEIREFFQRNKTSDEIDRALSLLQEHGMTRMKREQEREGQKRPTERWFALTAEPGLRDSCHH
jgi:DNA-binding transcriptional ArsR family regulator